MLGTTLLLYLLIGGVVAVAMPAGDLRSAARWGLTAGHVVFWPFFAPGLLGRGETGAEPDPRGHPGLRPRLYRAKARLLHAIATATNLSDGILAPQLQLIDAVMASFDIAEGRLREMDAVLQAPEFDAGAVSYLLAELRAKGLPDSEPRIASLLSRRENIARLRVMRQKTSDELERALFTLEAMSSRVLLLKFVDNPGSELERLLREVTDSITDLSTIVLEMSEL